MKLSNYIYIIISFLILNCAGKSFTSISSESSFKEAMILFNKEKYSKARDAFEEIIYSDPGSYSAIESLYYLAESLFNLESYQEASSVYNEYMSLSQNYELVNRANFLISKCRFLSSADYTKDQQETKYTIEVIQNYLDENPNSIYKQESEDMIYELRLKLAKKELEAGKLYLRTEKYDPALVYFNLILSEYYDTIYFDDALFYIVITYLLKDEVENAKLFLENNKESFLSNEKYLESKKIIEDSKNGLKFKTYFKLIK
tara:strand:+ start:63 stop:839 length:777 start_codon:yes stop_codon:yes gene_type:complete